MEALTQRQRKVLEFIEIRLRKGYPPSQREIAAHFGLAQNAVYQLTGYLKKKGYLTDSGGHRGLRLSSQYVASTRGQEGVPIVGRVAAGEPITAEENIEDYIDVKEFLGISDDVFLLRVSGESMVDEGIMDGDLVAVQPAAKVESGELAVVLLGEEATVKRVYIQKKRIALKPANKAGGYKIRYVKPTDKDIRIVGRVTACIRKMGSRKWTVPCT